MSWKGIVKVTFPSHLQTLMALFPKSKVLKGQVSRSDNIRTSISIKTKACGLLSGTQERMQGGGPWGQDYPPPSFGST